MSYSDFLDQKSQLGGNHGFEPSWIPDFLFDFQKCLLEWAIRKGRAAVLADCGLGKTPMQLAWCQSIVLKTNGRVLLLSPLAVGQQTEREGEKFGIDCKRVAPNGTLPKSKIAIANYEKLHLLDPSDFEAVCCDESSILKHFSGHTQKAVTRFMAKMKYRSLWTATAAPNDYTELGTASEALGELGYSDMLSRFFKMDDKKRCRMNDVKMARAAGGNHYARLAYRVSQQIGAWRLKGHAEIPFWRWVCSWSRACRKPSDLGFSDDQFILPELTERKHIITPKTPADGYLFTIPAFGLKEERDERRRTLTERCELAAELSNHSSPVVLWCHFNAEGDLLERLVPDAVQIKGSDPEEKREEAYVGFASGQIRAMVSKAKIAGFGLNWQHCNHVITFASHSFEQYYQQIRRCWRFGQKRPVTVDIISTDGEKHVLDNMIRKAEQATRMFDKLIELMNDAMSIERTHDTKEMETPAWL